MSSYESICPRFDDKSDDKIFRCDSDLMYSNPMVNFDLPNGYEPLELSLLHRVRQLQAGRRTNPKAELIDPFPLFTRCLAQRRSLYCLH
jgi:hypothetical protein